MRGGHSAGNPAVCSSFALYQGSTFQVSDYTCIVFNIAVLNMSEHRFDDLFQPYLKRDENCGSSSEVRSAATGSSRCLLQFYYCMHELQVSVLANSCVAKS